MAVTEEEIKELIDKQWVDRRSSSDSLLAAIALLNLESQTKIDNLNVNVDNTNFLLENTNLKLSDSNLKLDEIINLSGGELPKKDIIPGDIGVSLAKGSDGDIISCVINGITTNAIAKTDIGKHESIVVVPGGNFDEPYVVSTSILIKGDYDGFPVNISVTADGYIQVNIEGFTAKNEPATENPILAGMEYEALGALTTDGDAVGDKVPWKASQKGVPYVTITDSQGNAEISIIEQNATFGTDSKSLGLFGKYEVVPTTYDDGDAVPIALDEYGKVKLSVVDIQIGAVELKNANTDDRALISDANTARVATDHVLEVQHVDATGKVQPAGDSISNPIYVNVEGDVLYGEAIPTASVTAGGAAIEFDIASFSDLATLKQISITQLTAGTYNYTFEIWEKDGSGYTPGTYADHYLKIFSRDIDVREYNENIDQGLLYRDRDATSELHCRLVNNAAGTTSTFNVSIVAINST